ncbi:glucose 1-dehydrogenase [Ruegeria sp. WL0004]|uniref:Glucose 1-dehydrogenase n=1 Tax=Ruegeria marisflavi TaxID=2984152 RepID=A0ABT2WXF4_9RHOB|nr:glucose 1-dehydrogenase [Ruegeria sp. WL0004]MCU9840588.1 glucose 1-dehydrogenase [Ruegeria sp. WL0004]
MGRLSGKVAIITGGAGVIGKAAARRFAAEGARVLLVDLESAALQAVCKDLDCENVRSFAADVTSARDNAAMVAEAIRCFDGVDILLANAETEGAVGPIVDSDEALFDRVMAVNVKGPFLGMKAVLPTMAARGGGSIVITSSVAGIRGSAQVAPYSTSKHAVIGLMKSAAKEVAAQNIRVNTVNPGPVASRMMSSLEEGLAPGAAERAKSVMQSNMPIGRYATPEEIANVMLFLASDEAAFVTGAVYLADGSMMA